MIPVIWIAPLRLLKCLEGGNVETIDLLDALPIIFIEAFSIFPEMGERWHDSFCSETFRCSKPVMEK